MASITKEELRAEIVGKLVASDSDYFCAREGIVFFVLIISVWFIPSSVLILSLNFAVESVGYGTASGISVHHVEPAGVRQEI